jgi:hypothetical protein
MFIVKRDKWQFIDKNLTLGAISSRSALSLLGGALFKTLRLFLNAPRVS